MLAKICTSEPKQGEEGVRQGWGGGSPSMRCRNPIKGSWAGRQGGCSVWGIRLQVAWGGHLHRGGNRDGKLAIYMWTDQLSKYVKNNVSHVSHWQARVSQEKRKRLK